MTVLARVACGRSSASASATISRDYAPPSGHSQNHPYRPVSTASIKNLHTMSVVASWLPFLLTTCCSFSSFHLSIVSTSHAPGQLVGQGRKKSRTLRLAFITLVGVDGSLDLLAVLVEIVRVLALRACSHGRVVSASCERAEGESHELTLLTSASFEEGAEHGFGVCKRARISSSRGQTGQGTYRLRKGSWAERYQWE